MRRTLSVCPSVPLLDEVFLFYSRTVLRANMQNRKNFCFRLWASVTYVLFGTRRGPHIVRPSRPHKFLFFTDTAGKLVYQNVSVLDFVGAKDDGGGDDNWSYQTSKAPARKSSSPTNRHPTFYRPDATAVAHGNSVSKAAQDVSLRGQDRKAENRGRRPRAGWGSKPPPHQLGVQGSAMNCPSGVRPPKGFPLFSALRMASPDGMIVDYHIQPLGWCQTPVAPPCVRL